MEQQNPSEIFFCSSCIHQPGSHIISRPWADNRGFRDKLYINTDGFVVFNFAQERLIGLKFQCDWYFIPLVLPAPFSKQFLNRYLPTLTISQQARNPNIRHQYKPTGSLHFQLSDNYLQPCLSGGTLCWSMSDYRIVTLPANICNASHNTPRPTWIVFPRQQSWGGRNGRKLRFEQHGFTLRNIHFCIAGNKITGQFNASKSITFQPIQIIFHIVPVDFGCKPPVTGIGFRSNKKFILIMRILSNKLSNDKNES